MAYRICTLLIILASCFVLIWIPGFWKVETPDQLFLIALDSNDFEPGKVPKPEGYFHGYPTLGWVMMVKSERKLEIMTSLQNGIAGRRGVMDKSFQPRFGIQSMTNTESTDYVICFRSQQVVIYEEKKDPVVRPITRSCENLLAKILADARVIHPPVTVPE